MKKKLLLLISLILVIPQVFSEEPKIKIQIETSLLNRILNQIPFPYRQTKSIDSGKILYQGPSYKSRASFVDEHTKNLSHVEEELRQKVLFELNLELEKSKAGLSNHKEEELINEIRYFKNKEYNYSNRSVTNSTRSAIQIKNKRLTVELKERPILRSGGKSIGNLKVRALFEAKGCVNLIFKTVCKEFNIGWAHANLKRDLWLSFSKVNNPNKNTILMSLMNSDIVNFINFELDLFFGYSLKFPLPLIGDKVVHRSKFIEYNPNEYSLGEFNFANQKIKLRFSDLDAYIKNNKINLDASLAGCSEYLDNKGLLRYPIEGDSTSDCNGKL